MEESVRYALHQTGSGLKLENLKAEQLEAIEQLIEGRDVIAVLPTGYGKSLIFQLLPWIYQHKHQLDRPSIVITVSPINSLMLDQLSQLRNETNIKACCIGFEGSKGVTFSSDDDVELRIDVPYSRLEDGEFNIIYTHPETFAQPRFLRLLQSKTYQERVCAVVIDEVHMISEWGEQFRPAFRRLGESTCIFNTAAHLALTATATPSCIHDLKSVLNYRVPHVIMANPDRPNIFIDVRKRLPNNRKFNKLDEIIDPISTELLEERENFPLTIVYVENLESLGYFYQFTSSKLQENAYLGVKLPENRIFAQYHKDYPQSMKEFIVREIVKPNSKIRLIFATIALGMGLNAPGIVRIIHCRPPTTIEKYMQEIGRAGRSGLPSEAILYFNMSDISLSRKGLTSPVREFCLEEKDCLRLKLLKHFGFEEMLYTGDKNFCCSNCRKDIG